MPEYRLVKVIVTCGPSYEPIDEVRRLTNFSSGELGILLANALSRAGHDVVCLKGAGAPSHLPLNGPRLGLFTTNDDLWAKLTIEAADQKAGAIFHAAALCDYRVREVRSENGGAAKAAKIPSRSGSLTVVLEPLPKLITELRTLFPDARIAGWKYELEGTRDAVIAAAQRQMQDARTNACIVNGSAFGPGFGLCELGATAPIPFADKEQLCEGLVQWLP